MEHRRSPLEAVVEQFRNRRVFVTGHTGFKGAWLTKILSDAGARIYGYSLQPPTEPSLYNLLKNVGVFSAIGDIRDFHPLWSAFEKADPEFVIHMAAQPLVREAYASPLYTYDVNVMGTANILECVRRHGKVKSVLNITTDKVYRNNEWEWGYREDDVLDGYDPYSNSKSCSELVTHSYRRSFFINSHTPVSTVRAGNVIGGGDFADDRVIPDCYRAAVAGNKIILRNPGSVRPFQHVLEPLFAYLLILYKQYESHTLSGSYNVGPDDKDCIQVERLVKIFCDCWPGVSYSAEQISGPHEAGLLKLDCAKIKRVFNWHPIWDIYKAVEKTAEWYKIYASNGSIEECMERQITQYIADSESPKNALEIGGYTFV